MKKMTFALACASTVALFAEMAPKATFEDYTLGNGVANLMEPGLQSVYWLYNGASGSEDGSKVAGDVSAKYLELSTEGGTLWRSINAGNAAGATIDAKLGAAQAVGTGLYIDTMVQFTPTEDGGDGSDLGLDPSDKLAIWLNVTAGENGAPSTTNLCVRANSFAYGDEGPTPTKTTFVLTPVDDSALVINAGTWYRLTVAAIGNVLSDDAPGVIQAFQITVGGKLLKAASGEPFASGLGDFIASGIKKAAMEDLTVFPALQAMGNVGDPVTLQAVGFKGSGAIDNLQFTTQDPGGQDPAGVIDWDHPATSTGTAGDMFNLTGPIAAADGAKVATWAKKYSVSFADASTIEMDAFLLNCANTVDAINTAKANFKIVSIEQDAQGAWVAKVTGEKGNGEAFGNGYVVIKGSATVNGTYELATTDGTARFFKAFLVLEAPTTK